MRTQTKCTLSLCGLFIVEILPIPFTAIYGIYAIRKRPGWIPETVQNLYLDKPLDPKKPVKEVDLEGHDYMKTRRNCTIAITTMFLIDVIVPFTVPFGLYIVRRRPNWFRNTARKLYADQLKEKESNSDESEEDSYNEEIISGYVTQGYEELERSNFDFARSMKKK